MSSRPTVPPFATVFSMRSSISPMSTSAAGPVKPQSRTAREPPFFYCAATSYSLLTLTGTSWVSTKCLMTAAFVCCSLIIMAHSSAHYWQPFFGFIRSFFLSVALGGLLFSSTTPRFGLVACGALLDPNEVSILDGVTKFVRSIRTERSARGA